MTGDDATDLRSIRELEYIASIYMQHGNLDKAAEIMALAEDISRRVTNKPNNVEWIDTYRVIKDHKRQA